MQVIVFDTETTNLLSNIAVPIGKQPNVIELFGLKMELVPRVDGGEDWVEVDTLDILVKPPLPITAEITKITGITNEMVKDSPTIGAVWPKVREFFDDTWGMVAHNLSFDQDIIENENTRLGLSKFPFPQTAICTVEASEHLLGKRQKLIDLYEHLFGEKFESAHRAENDVRATARVFKRLWADGEI